MVNGVNFNPFSGKPLTAEQIQFLDTDQDSVVSFDELRANLTYLQSIKDQDEEGEVQLETDKKVDTTEETKATDAAETEAAAETKTEKKSFWKGVGDEFKQGHVIKGVLLGAVGVVGYAAKGAWSVVKGVGKGIWEGVKGVGKGIWEGVKGVGKAVWNGAKAVGKGIWNGIKSIGKGIASIFKGW